MQQNLIQWGYNDSKRYLRVHHGHAPVLGLFDAFGMIPIAWQIADEFLEYGTIPDRKSLPKRKPYRWFHPESSRALI
jgi:hypothetical protein